jgi:hypothetical protein
MRRLLAILALVVLFAVLALIWVNPGDVIFQNEAMP